MVNRLRMCTPIESPMRYAISMSQRFACGWSATSSHLSIAQMTTAVNSDESAYTSPSTAENQNVSVNV